ARGECVCSGRVCDLLLNHEWTGNGFMLPITERKSHTLTLTHTLGSIYLSLFSHTHMCTHTHTHTHTLIHSLTNTLAPPLNLKGQEVGPCVSFMGWLFRSGE